MTADCEACASIPLVVGAGLDSISVVPRDSWFTAAPHFFGLEAAREAHERGAEGVGAGAGATAGWTCVTARAGAGVGTGFVAGAGVDCIEAGAGVGTGEGPTDAATTRACFSGSGV